MLSSHSQAAAAQNAASTAPQAELLAQGPQQMGGEPVATANEDTNMDVESEGERVVLSLSGAAVPDPSDSQPAPKRSKATRWGPPLTAGGSASVAGPQGASASMAAGNGCAGEPAARRLAGEIPADASGPARESSRTSASTPLPLQAPLQAQNFASPAEEGTYARFLGKNTCSSTGPPENGAERRGEAGSDSALAVTVAEEPTLDPMDVGGAVHEPAAAAAAAATGSDATAPQPASEQESDGVQAASTANHPWHKPAQLANFVAIADQLANTFKERGGKLTQVQELAAEALQRYQRCDDPAIVGALLDAVRALEAAKQEAADKEAAARRAKAEGVAETAGGQYVEKVERSLDTSGLDPSSPEWVHFRIEPAGELSATVKAPPTPLPASGERSAGPRGKRDRDGTNKLPADQDSTGEAAGEDSSETGDDGASLSAADSGDMDVAEDGSANAGAADDAPPAEGGKKAEPTALEAATAPPLQAYCTVVTDPGWDDDVAQEQTAARRRHQAGAATRAARAAAARTKPTKGDEAGKKPAAAAKPTQDSAAGTGKASESPPPAPTAAQLAHLQAQLRAQLLQALAAKGGLQQDFKAGFAGGGGPTCDLLGHGLHFKCKRQHAHHLLGLDLAGGHSLIRNEKGAWLGVHISRMPNPDARVPCVLAYVPPGWSLVRVWTLLSGMTGGDVSIASLQRVDDSSLDYVRALKHSSPDDPATGALARAVSSLQATCGWNVGPPASRTKRPRSSITRPGEAVVPTSAAGDSASWSFHTSRRNAIRLPAQVVVLTKGGPAVPLALSGAELRGCCMCNRPDHSPAVCPHRRPGDRPTSLLPPPLVTEHGTYVQPAPAGKPDPPGAAAATSGATAAAAAASATADAAPAGGATAAAVVAATAAKGRAVQQDADGFRLPAGRKCRPAGEEQRSQQQTESVVTGGGSESDEPRKATKQSLSQSAGASHRSGHQLAAANNRFAALEQEDAEDEPMDDSEAEESYSPSSDRSGSGSPAPRRERGQPHAARAKRRGGRGRGRRSESPPEPVDSGSPAQLRPPPRAPAMNTDPPSQGAMDRTPQAPAHRDQAGGGRGRALKPTPSERLAQAPGPPGGQMLAKPRPRPPPPPPPMETDPPVQCANNMGLEAHAPQDPAGGGLGQPGGSEQKEGHGLCSGGAGGAPLNC